MGQDKAELQLGSQTVIERIFTTLQRSFTTVMINRSTPLPLQATYVADDFKDHGPLGGLHAVLKAAKTGYVYVTACDTPFIDRDVIESLMAHLSNDVDAVIPVYQGKVQPLAGVYATSLEKECKQLLEDGERKMQSLFDQCNVTFVDQFNLEENKLNWHFFNMNTKEEYELAQRYVKN
ncbi:putative molybdenum cofactor guanylyltransferase [Halobacillus andaensis]|uniref:Molybdenum cofactor guanylyltransferase n=2 Tax=Halobacillus andaensis TaxID=1176239 RepID=A0A917ET52_HALAA|nr:putative molybdenum cofactor guanylyltransferase [Halobacillus andaensis]